MKIPIIYEDDNLIAFNKPSGLLSIPDRFKAEIPNLQSLVQQQHGKLFTIHRLDKDTSGIISFAKNETMHKHLSQQFQDRLVGKFYTALTFGVPSQKKGSITLGIMEHPVQKGKMVVNKKGKTAHTDYEIIQHWNNYSQLKIQIHTGRTHQIRVHLAALGTPVLVDPFYGDGKPFFLSQIKKRYNLKGDELEEKPLLARLGLHASALSLNDMDGKPILIEAPLAKDMEATIKQLSKWLK